MNIRKHLAGRGPLGAITALLALSALALFPSLAGANASAQEIDLPQEQVSALANPSVVYISTEWSGYVYVPGVEDWMGPYSVGSACTGFIASEDGYIGTAGHCVTPDAGIEMAIIDAYFAEQLETGVLTQADVDGMYDEAIETWLVEGEANGSPPDLDLTEVWPTVAASGIEVSQPYTAQIVEAKPLEQGDVALLKVDTKGAEFPALEVAAAEPETGEAVTSAGFPGSVSDVVDPSLEPSFKTGTVSGHQNVEGAPFTEISSAMSGGMSGGPTVDGEGRVIGVNSFGPSGETEAFNFVTGTDSLSALLSRNGVPSELSETDAAYRAGLDLYFAEDYDAAAEQFDAVLAAQPNHAQAQKYQADASKAAETQGGGSSSPMPLVLIGASVVVAGGIVFVVLRHRRKPTTPAALTVPVSNVTVTAEPDGSVLSGPTKDVA